MLGPITTGEEKNSFQKFKYEKHAQKTGLLRNEDCVWNRFVVFTLDAFESEELKMADKSHFHLQSQCPTL